MAMVWPRTVAPNPHNKVAHFFRGDRPQSNPIESPPAPGRFMRHGAERGGGIQKRRALVGSFLMSSGEEGALAHRTAMSSYVEWEPIPTRHAEEATSMERRWFQKVSPPPRRTGRHAFPLYPPTENLAGMMFSSNGQVTSQAAKNGVQNGEWRPNSVRIASRIAPIILLPYLASCGLTPDCQTASQMSEPKPKSA